MNFNKIFSKKSSNKNTYLKSVYLFLTVFSLILSYKLLTAEILDLEDYLYGYIYFLSYYFMFWFSSHQDYDLKEEFLWIFQVIVFFFCLYFEYYLVVKLFILLQIVIGILMSHKQLKKLREKNKEIQFLSYHDSMTGVYNRRYFLKKLNKSENIDSKNLSIIVADVNNLKDINDNLGHKKGDEYILSTVNILRSELRKTDQIARIGGDEFIVFLPDTGKKECKQVVKRLEKRIAEHELEYFSVAFGFISNSNNFNNLEEMINVADNKMYSNKKEMKS